MAVRLLSRVFANRNTLRSPILNQQHNRLAKMDWKQAQQKAAPKQAADDMPAKPKKGTLLNGDDASKVFNTEEFADKLYAKWTKLINRVDPVKRPSAIRLVKEWIELVEHNRLVDEDSGWKLISGLRRLRNTYDRNRRAQVSRLITKWIAGKGGAA
jgi:hypothetical protein